MKLNVITPRNFINPLLSRKSADKAKFEAFKQSFEVYQQKLAEQIKTKQTEPNMVTNVVKPFFESLGYQAENYSQKGQISIDLAIMQGITPLVLIEAKLPNSHDMITADNLNKKAFHQAILYFMNERAKDNKSLFHIIVTDFNNWFVFDAKDFDRLFWRNKAIKKHHEALTNQSLLGDRTEDFYRDIEKVLPTLQKDLIDKETIDCAHFNVLQKHTEKELTAIYKLLSPNCLLKSFNPNDANSLNKHFYKELLYILGLEETKKDGKNLIEQAKDKQSGTLYVNIANKLSIYKNNQEPQFEEVIKLIIIWVNRILFLKLLESQVVKWTKDPANKFLASEKVAEYDDLETLFFEVLAKPIHTRKFKEYNNIPYLNSSLFDIHPEESIVKISNLTDGLEIDYYPYGKKTVLKDSLGKPKTGKVSTLPYLLAFLDAYDFANDSDEELSNHNKTLINASVLGLIFEKINGYKDGSFYTPSFITMYMARETIEKSVIQKFNQAKGWQCKTLLDLINKDYEIAEANAFINSIKVCDPAVGSGHFLVSALNELLRIKSELGVLVDESGKRIKDYKLSIENDELIVMSDEGEQFEYKKGNDEKTRIQKTLFKQKQTLIENCLFGVDINPNSVNICRLRLWIELLKNAYYKPNGELDTLPNIDINIKCGNSLISRFGLTDEIKDKNIKNEIQEYKAKVTQYKNNEGSKQQVLQAIDAIKAKFQTSLKSGHQTTQKLNNALVEFVSKFGFDGLSSHQKLKAIDDLKLLGKQDSLFGDAIDQAEKNKQIKSVENAWQAVEEIESGKIYQNAFEWRFEFPEVLNEQGEFVGFDVVIGNPPYGVKFADTEKSYCLMKFIYQDYQLDSYLLFIEQGLNLIKIKGQFSYLIPNTWLTNLRLKKIRELVVKNSFVNEIVHYKSAVFEDAVVDTQAVFLKKENIENQNVKIEVFETAEISSRFLANQLIWSRNTDDSINIFMDNSASLLKIKLEKDAKKLGEVSNVVIGVKPYQVGKGKPAQTRETVDNRVFDSQTKLNDSYKPLLRGSDIQKFKIIWDGKRWIKYGVFLAEPRVSANFDAIEKIVVRQTGDTLIAALDENQFICMNNLHVITIPENGLLSIKYLIALINSKLLDYYHYLLNPEKGEALAEVKKENLEKLPIAIISDNEQKIFIQKVEDVMNEKLAGKDTSKLEAEIDALVYDLYGLTQEEIEIVEGRAQNNA